jgi:hypothetical protein
MYDRLTLEDIVEAHMVLDAYDDAQERLEAKQEAEAKAKEAEARKNTPKRPPRRR